MLFTDHLSNKAKLPCIFSNFDKISCKGSEDGVEHIEVELPVEVAAGVLEESTPNNESTSSFEIEPSLILH